MNTILIAALVCGVIALVSGLVIGVASKLFAVPSDPRVDLVIGLLPGANCGGCGKAGCADFAKSVVAGENPPNKCPVSSAEQISAIAHALGIEAGSSFKQVAVVLCGGDLNQARQHTLYNGVYDCVSAAMVAGGPKSCSYGCFGMGSCARSCPFGAIEIINNLAVVHPEVCVGCGTCVATCPRHLIKLVPAEAKVHIFCSSPLKGPEKKKVCSVPCLGCRKCVKAGAEGQFTVEGVKVSVNYDTGENGLPGEDVVAAAGCPTGCLMTVAKHLETEYAELAEAKKETENGRK
ncbi:MAG: RnfABCDGE type electron transport complex subunit B [Victivallaceae bacterium]|nr:RnfABCDGE type electron transport complex subunit B [Victivallaceae bacterium]